jgi:4-hydroxybenzoyl-CoA thioesterase
VSEFVRFVSTKQIRFHHCDPAGIVFYPQYFVLFNELVEDWFNQGLDVDFAQFVTRGRHGLPTARVECDFLEPSRIGEQLQFSLSVAKVGRSSLTLAVEVRAGDVIRVRATLVVVHVQLDVGRPVPFPQAFRERLARFVEQP